MEQTISTYLVDSFTDQVFKGNPAGVCLLKEELSESLMQAIAAELGLSETAFVLKKDDHYHIRYFSPKEEIPLCGHATLASAKVLFDQHPNISAIHFITEQQVDLPVRKDDGQILMEFPVYDTYPKDVSKDMLDALGLQRVVANLYNRENNILMLVIEEAELLERLTPDFNALVQTNNEISGVLVTAPSTKAGFDFESRYFWPWVGTDEDPVTGATHTFMTKYWGDRLGKTQMKSFQSSERTGFMDLELAESGKLLIKGFAKVVLEGVMHLPK
ncbi:MAG: PhzF family phenazine biosynthesis isomerase [Bacteroidota bacterium]